MSKTPVLNWYSRDKRMIRGLKKALERKKEFVTLRLGNKWANRLNPGQKVAVSMSDNQQKPLIIGYACVIEVKKQWLIFVSQKDLMKNIGAHKFEEVLQDMRTVYGQKKVVDEGVVVSVLRFLPIKKSR